MHAVVSTSGKQYRVKKDDIFEVDRIQQEVGAQVELDVLAIGEGETMKLGNPKVEGASVKAEVVEHMRGPKLIAFKMKRRKGSRKTKGHRQELTRIRVSEVSV